MSHGILSSESLLAAELSLPGTTLRRRGRGSHCRRYVSAESLRRVVSRQDPWANRWWWEYWQEHWQREDGPDPIQVDHTCEVTIPIKGG